MAYDNDWPVFKIDYHSILGSWCEQFFVDSPKSWQRAQMAVADRDKISASEARCRLLCATQAAGPMGAPHSDVFGEVNFTNVEGQTGTMVNVATWAMDNELKL